MKAIYGLFSDPDSAQHAVDELRKTGVADRSITVITSQPYEEYEFSHRYKQTWIFWIAAGGGALGLAAGLTLAYLTETLWPIVTGGMPIVSWWPNIIIMFELTMLGSIVGLQIDITRLVGKSKLGQNKEERDIRGAGEALTARGNSPIGDAMLAHAAKKLE